MRWTVRSQLICLVLMMSVLMVAIGVNAHRGMSGADDGMQNLLRTSHILRNHIESDMMHDALRADVYAAMLATTPAEAAQVVADVEEHATQFRDLLQENNKLAVQPDVKAALASVGPSLQIYISAAEDIVAAAGKDKERGRAMMPAFIAKFHELEVALSDASDLIEKNANGAERDAQAEVRLVKTANLIGLLSAVIIGALLGMFIVRRILRGVWSLEQMITPIARGELGANSEPRGDDEFGRLLDQMQVMDAKLSSVIGKARLTAGALGDAAGQLSQGNDDLNQRTQEQAAALQETATSMEEIASTVKRNADNARAANKLAVEARAQADQGGGVVASAIGAMNEITASSRRIADIIGTIDEIAFQTNLLALNAAVEAARAGELGRGFAVVAGEVGNLAKRSARAARETKDLINESGAKVAVGTKLVQDSGATISNIMESVRKVTDIVSEIAAASDTQAAGVEQVNRAISQIDEVTQQNAALVEENAAASKLVSVQSEQLATDISYFKIATGAVQVADTQQRTHFAPAVAERPRYRLAS